MSWLIAVSSKSNAEKQLDLMRQAAGLTGDGIYILAVPLLEEAVGYNAAYTIEAETELKKVYLALIDNRGFGRKYSELLEKQMSRKDTHPDVYAEAAEYYLGISRLPEALHALRTGIEKTGNDRLVGMYESHRYVYETNRVSYDSVTAIHGAAIQVLKDGLWGIARADGSLLIPCIYEKVSTYSSDRAIVKKDGEIYAVDRNNNRIALLSILAADFGNFSDNRLPLLIDGSWMRATGDFTCGTARFERLGMYSGGYAAAKTGGLWGVIDVSSGWLVPAEYDGIIQDELGRSYAQGAVFIKTGGSVRLFSGGKMQDETYDDARPFSNEGYAAVKRNGKWGFIDTNGIVMIDFLFDDALSFGQHLAAVRQGEFWGYINKYGHIVIEPVFIEAKSFSSGSAPVLTQRGWQFITLLEYKKGASL